MANDYDRGTAPLRLEWVDETSEGTTPSDPEWNGFSYNIINYWNWEPEANTTALRGAGEPKPQGFFNGSETHDASFEYSLARWFKDGSGNTQDPANDFLDLSDDNDVTTTHSVVSWQEYSTGGADSAGRRVYVVGKGGHPGSVTVPFETSEGAPIAIGLEYQFEKIRAYTIDQPSSGTTLEIANNGTSDVDVTIEDEGAATSETNTVTGGGTTTTTGTFDNIDAVELATDVDGDVVVSDGGGTDFVTIKGSDSYPAGEGDLGIPALGSGSHASSISEGNEVIFLDDQLDYDGTAIADEIESGELTVDFGLNSNSQVGTAKQNIHATEWTAEVTASVAGEDVTSQQMVDYLTEVANDIKWTANQGSITLTNSRLTSPGEFVGETSQGKLMLDGTRSAEDITVSNEGA
jgi:hypothetical protein